MTVPTRRSIYRFCSAIQDVNGTYYLTEAPPYRYDAELTDTIEHHVVAGDTWHSIAARHYSLVRGEDLSGPELLAKIVADFQPVYVDDPTVMPTPGSIVYVPGFDTLNTLILSEARRAEYEA